ncbi:unnamed protein product [Peronospora destructor]|uniref:Uncharacterized protein n=1 Tax=Peronospora destructor TaxID=86335 RepID=A0AAV0TTT0_9STRA|nr:unnamed protein product [Peronospora destructor]
MVKIVLRPLLIEAFADHKCLEYQPTSEGLTHVELVLGQEQQLQTKIKSSSLNGQNEETYLSWTHHQDEEPCLLDAALRVMTALGMAWRVKVGFVRQLKGGTVTTQSLYSKVFMVEGSLPRRRQMLLSLRALTISIANALSIMTSFICTC